LLDARLVCVVDDDDSVRRALVELITSMGYRCSGYESVEAVLSSGEADVAACIITDIHMPGLDAFALMRELGSRGCSAGVIVITGRSEGHLERRALDAGAICFMRKPLQADALGRAITLSQKTE
jgi:FixJ family two-component response regulator